MTILKEEFDYVRCLVREQTGVSLGPDKEYLVKSRLTILAHREGLGSLRELIAQLRLPRAAPLRAKVAIALLTHETLFFRNPRLFDVVAKTVLPELARRRADDRELRIWCAACSTGQEAYSVAILVREHFARSAGWSVRILGSDLSENALATARAGTYGPHEVSRGLPVSYRDKYFTQTDGNWRVRNALRETVELQKINLAAAWPHLRAMDMIVLRNVLIYFSESTRRSILRKAKDLLRPEGFLLLGNGEALGERKKDFTVVAPECFRLRAK